MPVPTRVNVKNIWVAAGDGDLERVQDLVERQCKHAAASYGQLHVLEYLISKGGDVNIPDQDGDTPLYTVETIDTARFLIHHGATTDRHNNDGISPADHLAEEFPEIAHYVHSLSSDASPSRDAHPGLSRDVVDVGADATRPRPSRRDQDVASERLTESLMRSVQDIMARASDSEDADVDAELRAVVGRAVVQGVVQGYGMSVAGVDEGRRGQGDEEGADAKRRKLDEGDDGVV